MGLLVKDYRKRDGRGRSRKVQVVVNFDSPRIFEVPYNPALHRHFILNELRYRTRRPPAFLGRNKKKSERIGKYERHVPSQWKAAILRDAPLLKGFFEEEPAWREKSPEEYKEGVAFYLGHCYVCAGEYGKAKPYLVEALGLGLPLHLEYRARFELGIVYMALGGYARAKIEFETALQTADAEYLKDGSVWKRLEICCRQLGLQEEAEKYARMK